MHLYGVKSLVAVMMVVIGSYLHLIVPAVLHHDREGKGFGC